MNPELANRVRRYTIRTATLCQTTTTAAPPASGWTQLVAASVLRSGNVVAANRTRTCAAFTPR